MELTMPLSKQILMQMVMALMIDFNNNKPHQLQRKKKEVLVD